MTVKGELNGINEQLLEKLVVDVGNYADNLLDTLNLIDDNFKEAIKQFNCDVTSKLKDSYDGISSNYRIVNSNILSYGTDYAKVKKAYVSRGLSIVKQVNSIDTKKANFYEEGV